MHTTPQHIDLNKSIRPQDDFFGYVNSNWIAKNPIPASESRWGSFNVLRDQAWSAMKAIYEELTDTQAESGSVQQQARDFFYTGMHNSDLEATHLSDVREYFGLIDAIQNTTDLAKTIGTLQTVGINGPWRIIIDLDEHNSSQHIFRLHQAGTTLPDRHYYLDDSKKMKNVRKAYSEHLQKLHALFPKLAGTAEQFSQTILTFETDLAKNSRTQTELRDIEANYHKTSFADLQKTYANIDWTLFAKAIGWHPSDQISVDQPEALAYVNEQFTKRDLNDWKIYLKWQFLQLYYSSISERFAAFKFEFFGKVLSGTSEILPKWKRVTLMVDSAIGDAVGRLYVEKHFSEDAKKQVLDMVEVIRATYKKRIQNLSWMSEATKTEAQKKLANMKILIGYPDTWRDFSALTIGRKSYIQNIIAAERFANDYWLSKIGHTPSRDEWLMFPQTVNAYHDPNRLVICFPAAILQPPFFSPTADAAVNLGGIGAVIGHEFTHGFDDQGCQFDENGVLRMWQQPTEREAFNKHAQLIIDQADNFAVLPDLNLKGKLVIGESIADLGGLELAYDALQDTPQTPGPITRDQRFFINYAVTECDQTRNEKLREFTLSDPHPNSTFRINGILQHVDAFYEAFGVKEGDALFRKPEDRAKIW